MDISSIYGRDEVSNMNKFKIGDRVKVKECSYEQGISCIGHEGIIVNIDYNYDYFYTIKFDSGFIPAHANCYRDDELILLPKKRNKPTKQKELIATAFKIGDRVKVKRCVPDCRCIGHTGVIIRVEENNHFPYIVKFDDEFNSSHVNCYKTKELILLPKKRTKSVKQKELTAIAYELIDLIEAYKNGKRDGYQKGYEAGKKSTWRKVHGGKEMKDPRYLHIAFIIVWMLVAFMIGLRFPIG